MNDKLKEWANKPFRPVGSRGGSGRGTDAELVRASKSTEGGKRHVVRFSFHARAAKQAGWMKDDHIRIEVTEKGIIAYRTNDPKDTTLIVGGGTGSKSSRLYVRVAVVPEFYNVFPVGAGREVEISNHAIAFVL